MATGNITRLEGVWPETHERAVRDSAGVNLETKLGNINSDISQLSQDVNDLSNEEKNKTGGIINIVKDVFFTARSYEYSFSAPIGASIVAKLIADGVTPSSGMRVRVKYEDDALADFTSSPLTSIGATATLTAQKNVKSIVFYNNDANTTATVEISAVYSVEGTLNTNVISADRLDILDKDPAFNLFDYTKAVANVYINGTNGFEAYSSGLYASPFISVKAQKKYFIGGKVLARFYAFYDANKTYLSGDNATSGFITQLTTPANAAFVRFTGQLASYADIIFSENKESTTDIKYVPNPRLIIPIEVSTEDLQDVSLANVGNIIDRTKLIVNAYINPTDGSVKNPGQDYWVATDWCEVEPTKSYYWDKIQNFYAAFYDENKEFITGFSTSNRMPNPVVAPVNARYARFTLNNTAESAFGHHASDVCWVAADSENRTPNDFKSYSLPNNVYTEREIGVNPCDYAGKEISLFNKILCVGDSLMFGNENVASGSSSIVSREPLYNIPAYIKKMSGVDTTNAAHSGYTAAQWLADFGTQDLSGHDAVIVQIGVNDWLAWNSATDSAIDTFKTTLGQIIDYVISQNAYNNGGTLKNKPKVFVATQFPALSYLKNSYGISVDVLNNAIRAIVGLRSDCFLLDMAVYSHSNDNIAFNRGHLSSLGYRQVAQDYCGIISKFINDNLNLFVDTAFVGTPATQFAYSSTEW